MTTAAPRPRQLGPGDDVTTADILGTERRTRRGPAPVPAGSLREDGSADYGIFGPGSVAWDVILHPGTVVFHHAAQQLAQHAYNPIEAGIRDHEPLSKKGQAGTLTIFDTFERASRGAGMHLPLWLGNTPTATFMATWLHKVHSRVVGDVIDVSIPELGGYDAASPRESMWAALTEMHPMLRVYEAFAFRDGRFPRRLDPERRDQYVKEVGAYLRLHGSPEDEIPETVAELAALYEKYKDLFVHSETIAILPATGEVYTDLMSASIKKNFRPSHIKAMRPMLFFYLFLGVPVLGALSGKARTALGVSKGKARRAVIAKKMVLPLAWLMQRRFIERRMMRLMWGADGVMLFESARKLHKQVIAERASAGRGV